MELNAILIGVSSYSEKLEKSMNELEQLAFANEIKVSNRMVQLLNSPSNYGYFRKGKLDELNNYLNNHDEVNIVIADDELSSSIIRNIKKSIDRKDIMVMDRTTLILDIFEKRAQTKEAINQVKIAKYQYQLTHLVSVNENYDQQRGSSALHNKGAGEKQINLDRNEINKRISILKKDIEQHKKVVQEKQKQRDENGLFKVALVGYTNAGKSTIMNNLVQEDKQVFEKDMLFATLDTSTRNVYLKNNRSILLSDTVGFIDKLPHNLVVSFNSTLKEALDADLILYVVDFSDENFQNHIQVTNDTLEEIGLKEEVKQLYIYNKIDNIDKPIPSVRKDNIVYMSARNEIGIQLIKDVIYEELFSCMKRTKLLIPYSKSNHYDYLNKTCNIVEVENTNDGYLISVDLLDKEIEYFKEYISI